MVRLSLLTVASALALPTSAAAQTCPAPAALVGPLSGPIAHVRYLADDALEGREVASPGALCAAQYIADAFTAAGLEGGVDEQFFQEFEVRVGSQLGNHNMLSVDGADYPLAQGWVPYGYSAADDVSGTLAYAGPMGATSDDPHAQPFGPGGLEGTIVVIEGETDSPDGFDAHFPALLAQRAGASGLLVLVEEGTMPSLDDETRGALQIPVAAFSGEAAAQLKTAAEAGGQVRIMTHIEPLNGTARNVVAVLPGSGGEDAGFVVVGAHFDHLGHGGGGSLAPDAAGQIHNGADDNASGTAAIIEVARELFEGPQLNRTVVFLAFTGEERGLWGSGHWANQSTVPLERIEAMLNLDMVGRLGDGKLTVFGVGTAPEWDGILESSVSEVNRTRGSGLEIATAPDGYGPSDHSSFYGKDIPVLHFFSNTHVDYHRPSDDWEKIDREGLATVTALVAETTRRLAGSGQLAASDLTLIKGAGAPSAAPGGSEEGSTSRGYGPYLGTVPDMTPGDVEGVRLTGVREGSPAEKGGLQSGDVIVEFAGQAVTDLYTYTYALRDHKPGDEVEIVVVRGSERVALSVVLGRR